jgi:16S rRNA (uracil1498-N3)-methyltransferase
MNRFYIEETITGDTVCIKDPEQLHHLKDVLRLKTGDEVVIFDTDGNEFLSTISGLERKQAILAVKARKAAAPGKVKLTIACAIPRHSRMDDIIDKLTQLGVDSIIPLVTERVVVKLEENTGSRLMRWKKIAMSAAEQSQRNRLPLIAPVMGMSEVLVKAADFDLKLIPTLGAECRPFRDVMAGFHPANTLVLIGPEGDFTPQEIKRAVESGFIPVSLGNNILRVETAAVAVASYLRLACL